MILQLSTIFKLDRYQEVFILFMLHSSILEAATNGFQPKGTQCACAGDNLIYNCSIMGGTATLWRGTAFDCPLDGSEITLRHSQFVSNQAFQICNNGDIVGRGLAIINNCYTSQLNVTVRENFNNKTVQCLFTSSEGTRRIGESLLSVVSATNLYPPPDNLYLADAQPGTLVFNWTPVLSNCSTLQYNIASDCGTCPIVTNMTTTICSDLQLTTNGDLCHFRVSSHACDLVGNPSSPTAVTLKVPNIPQVEIVPSYSTDSQALERLFIVTTVNQTEDHFYISGNISGSPISYTAYGSNFVSGTSFNSTVSMAVCEEAGGCPIELSSSYCSQSTTINVTISASNKLGEGPRSNPFIIECTNNFVQVVYKKTTSESIISCVFLNQSDVSEKTCCVNNQLCDLRGPQNVQECNKDSPYNIKLDVSGGSGQMYCYTVTASNDTYTLKVEGTFTLGDNRGENVNTAAVTAGVIVPIVSMILLLLGIGIIIAITVKSKRRQPHSKATVKLLSDIHLQNPLKQYLTPYHLPDTLKLHKAADCELRDFITETLSLEFRRGHTYYEFTNEVENILEGKEVLLQDKNTKKWFQLVQPKEFTAGGLQLYGEGIARSSFGERYRVFIQSFGSGARHLSHDSSILYNHSVDQVQPDVLPLVPVCSEYFAHKVIDSEEEECTVQQFCTQNRLNATAFNIFLTVEHLPEEMRDQPPRDVILMNRESRELFTGPFARQMLDLKNGGDSQLENEKWKVFVLLKQRKQGLVLKRGSEFLYQDSMYRSGSYAVLNIDQDTIRMSKFIETKLKCQYEDRKAFYEVTENEEDLLYCKKVLRLQTKELDCEELKLQSLIEYFYAIPGVPAVAVKPEQLNSGLHHHKIFIQSTSQGSRCLKAGTKILYLKEYIKWNPIDAQTGDHTGVHL